MIELFDLPHAEARRLVAEAPVYLLVNPVEYHGPHLSLHNDRLLARGVTEALHARLGGGAPLLVGADLEIGVEPAPGPGSRATPYETARALVREACRALVELGARRVALMTFHGAPLHAHALEAGVELLERAGVRAVQPFNVVTRKMLTLEDTARFAPAVAHVEDPAERAALLAGLPRDVHAGFFETSLALHFAPASVSPSYTSLPPCPAVTPEAPLAAAARVAGALGRTALQRELALAAWGRAWTALRPHPGYTGSPHRATATAGAVFADAILEEYEQAVGDVWAGRARSPAPIMTWVKAVAAVA